MHEGDPKNYLIYMAFNNGKVLKQILLGLKYPF